MNNWQKVINVCFAVIVTLLIYQNQQLSDEKMDYYDVERIVERCVPHGEIFQGGGYANPELRRGKIEC